MNVPAVDSFPRARVGQDNSVKLIAEVSFPYVDKQPYSPYRGQQFTMHAALFVAGFVRYNPYPIAGKDYEGEYVVGESSIRNGKLLARDTPWLLYDDIQSLRKLDEEVTSSYDVLPTLPDDLVSKCGTWAVYLPYPIIPARAIAELSYDNGQQMLVYVAGISSSKREEGRVLIVDNRTVDDHVMQGGIQQPVADISDFRILKIIEDSPGNGQSN